MNIAQIAPLWYPVPPTKYGGTERVVYFLTRGLIENKHNVSLFASGDSSLKSNLLSVVDKSLNIQEATWKEYALNILNHSVAFEQSQKFDLLHCHWEVLGFFFSQLVPKPVLHTLHNIPKPDSPLWKVFEYYQNKINVVFISEAERNNMIFKPKNSWVVYNGIDETKFTYSEKNSDEACWIARFSRDKGPDVAIKVAQQLNIKLNLAGLVSNLHTDFFNHEIKPNLNNNIKYLGEKDQKGVIKIFKQSKVFIFPLNWEEPFGLVVAEANACGTPVVTFSRGSMSELIKDGFNGFLIKPGDINGMVKAVKKIYEMPKDEYLKMRQNCRKHFEDNFTISKMVEGYERVYQEIINKMKK